MTNLLYSGESFDSRIGQQNLRARWYQPGTGRFDHLDPFAGDQTSPFSFNKYAYTSGDPVSFNDPTGMFEGLAGLLGSISIGNSQRASGAGASFSGANAAHKAMKLWEYRDTIIGLFDAFSELAKQNYLGALLKAAKALTGVDPSDVKGIIDKLKHPSLNLTNLSVATMVALPPIYIDIGLPRKGGIARAFRLAKIYLGKSNRAQELIGEIGTYLISHLIGFGDSKLVDAHKVNGPDFIFRHNKQPDLWAIVEAKGGTSRLGKSGLAKRNWPKAPQLMIWPTPRPTEYQQMGATWLQFWIRKTILKNAGTLAGDDFEQAFGNGKPILAMVVSLDVKRQDQFKIGAQVFMAKTGVGFNPWTGM